MSAIPLYHTVNAPTRRIGAHSGLSGPLKKIVMQYLKVPIKDVVTGLTGEVLDSYRALLYDILDRVANAETPDERWRAKKVAAQVAEEWVERSVAMVQEVTWRLQEDRDRQHLELRERFAAYYPEPVDDGDEEPAAEPEPPALTAD